MTWIIDTKESCLVCGRESKQSELRSTNTRGYMDLDMRPAPMARSTMWLWVRKCPACGYCNDRLSEARDKAEETVGSDAYRRQLKDRAFTELANRFLCQSMIVEAAGDLRDAGWAALHAAWSCDDHKKKADAADCCRGKAIALFRRARAAGVAFAADAVHESLLLADLLRRTRRFEEALAACEQGLRAQPQGAKGETATSVVEDDLPGQAGDDGLVFKALAFEMQLAQRGDSRMHHLGEAADPARGEGELSRLPAGLALAIEKRSARKPWWKFWR